MAATFWEVFNVEEGFWVLARIEGIGTTNNAVERALRHALI
jgi:hypothetical protein